MGNTTNSAREVVVGQIRTYYNIYSRLLVLEIKDCLVTVYCIDDRTTRAFHIRSLIDLGYVIGYVDPEKARLLYG